MRTRIRGATCVLPGDIVQADVILENGRIASVDAPAAVQTSEVIEAEGLYLLPGVVDDQVHFREPGFTHKEDLRSASLACAKGGVTSFLEMPNTRPNTTTVDALHQKLDRASRRSLVNYGFYIGATPTNLAELKAAQRTPGIKIFMGSSTGDLLVDNQDALERIFGETSLPICAHCEDEAVVQANLAAMPESPGYAYHSKVRTTEAAVICTKRALDLAHRHKHRFHVLHLSTAPEAELVANHQNLVTAEVCPHHLYFSEADYERLGARVQMNPSVKTRADNEALWQALAGGTIQVVATDHAPHTLAEKVRPYPHSPSGVPAVENLLALMLDAVHAGRLTLRQVVDALCDAPARVWDMVGKGRIAEGYDADLVLVDLDAEHTVLDHEQQTKCKWSPWHGVSLRGKPVGAWVMGQRVYWKGDFDYAVRGREIIFDHQRGGYWATQGAS